MVELYGLSIWHEPKDDKTGIVLHGDEKLYEFCIIRTFDDEKAMDGYLDGLIQRMQAHYTRVFEQWGECEEYTKHLRHYARFRVIN